MASSKLGPVGSKIAGDATAGNNTFMSAGMDPLNLLQHIVRDNTEGLKKSSADIANVRQLVNKAADDIIECVNAERRQILGELDIVEQTVQGDITKIRQETDSCNSVLSTLKETSGAHTGDHAALAKQCAKLRERLPCFRWLCTLDKDSRLQEQPIVGSLHLQRKGRLAVELPKTASSASPADQNVAQVKKSKATKAANRFQLLQQQHSVMAVTVVCDHLCVVHNNDTYLWFYKPSGEFVKQTSMAGMTGAWSIATLSNAGGRVVLTCPRRGMESIHWVTLSPELDIIQYQQQKVSYRPWGISVTPTGGVAVAAQGPSSIRLYDNLGTEIRTIQLAADIKFPRKVLVLPRPCHNGSFSICYDIGGGGNFPWVDEEGAVKHRLHGILEGQHMHKGIRDFLQDSEGRLVVAMESDIILQLDTEGKFQACLLRQTDETRHPRRLCLDEANQTLYIACGDDMDFKEVLTVHYPMSSPAPVLNSDNLDLFLELRVLLNSVKKDPSK